MSLNDPNRIDSGTRYPGVDSRRTPRRTGRKIGWLPVLGLIVAVIGIIAWNIYTSSPSYLARKQLKGGDEQLQAGDLVAAAEHYRQVAIMIPTTDSSAAAREKFRKLVLGLQNNGTAADKRRIVESAVQPPHIFTLTELHDLGMNLVDTLMPLDLDTSLAIVDTLSDVSEDTQSISNKRMTILEAMVKAEPQNPLRASDLAVVYESRNELEKCEPLLSPHAATLGDTEGALILGSIYSMRGELDRAATVLLPYTESHLEKLHAAEKAMEQALVNFKQRIISTIENGNAPRGVYERAGNAATDEARAAVFDSFYMDRMAKDPALKIHRNDIQDKMRVVPIALETGMVLLQLGRQVTDPDQRREHLEKAENLLLAVKGVAGEDDQFQISLSQVYYWLGKHREGRKLLEKYLDANGRNANDLLAANELLRAVGSFHEAFEMSEEAYKAADSDDLRQAAAVAAALDSVDTEERIRWLELSDQKDPQITALLAESKATLAASVGDEQEAIRNLREVIRIYTRDLPENAATLNNQSIAHTMLYQLTGAETSLKSAADCLEKAVVLDPGDSILLRNTATALFDIGVRHVIGDRIDLGAHKSRMPLDLLPYLYNDPEAKHAVIRQLRENDDIRRAISYHQKVLLLAPKSPSSCDSLEKYFSYIQDETGLNELLRWIEENEPSVADQLGFELRINRGEFDQQFRELLKSSVTDADKLLKEMESRQNVDSAIAACSLVGHLMAAEAVGIETEIRRIVDLAERAFQTAPSFETRNTLIEALCFRGSLALAEQHSWYAEILSKCRPSLGHSYLIGEVLNQSESLRPHVTANPDVQRAMSLVEQMVDECPGESTAWHWAVLASNPKIRDQIAANLNANHAYQLHLKLKRKRSPANLRTALLSAWMAEILGDAAERKKVSRQFEAYGISFDVK